MEAATTASRMSSACAEGLLATSVREQCGELLTAQPEDGRGWIRLQGVGDDRGDAPETLITGEMAVDVVVVLEDVDIDREESERLLVCQGALPVGGCTLPQRHGDCLFR